MIRSMVVVLLMVIVVLKEEVSVVRKNKQINKNDTTRNHKGQAEERRNIDIKKEDGRRIKKGEE